MSKKSHSGIWDYLDALGILEKGTDEEIKAVKKAYWKKYFSSYKQKQRNKKPEYTVNFSKENGELETVAQTASRHKMTITAFIHSATLAYIKKTFVVPDSEQVAKLELILSECLNEIKLLVKQKEKFFWGREEKIEAIEKRIEKLETQINNVFRNPPLLTHLSQHDNQNQNT